MAFEGSRLCIFIMLAYGIFLFLTRQHSKHTRTDMSRQMVKTFEMALANSTLEQLLLACHDERLLANSGVSSVPKNKIVR